VILVDSETSREGVENARLINFSHSLELLLVEFLLDKRE
jgi:hypothetical protein